ncbi:uncharacterized protein CTRU02_205531 [Colletotrichum truncatum]|uniref:Uncharacterized protein n=1 Tax=Colletotrichum truncatum TaxID=5467 RepID=A0ACC3Z488_COLTU|nr:uncharacterized protein CTRU02_04589 [Colletotrichum truncatum]KAF6795779.1 hypothetical protein CTRU02_04589 [Colletotrichum truncatum]
METNDNVEILVHVTAPCRAVDDARYRALAQAYLDFNPASRTKILDERSQGGANTVIPSSQAEPVASQSTTFHALVPSSDATQLHTSPPRPNRSPQQSFMSVQLSFRSVLDNINSPGLGRPVLDVVPSSQPDVQTQLSQASWRAPPSVIGDSQPVNDISLAEFSSPSRLFEHLACQFDSPNVGSSQQTQPQGRHQVSEAPVEEEYGYGEDGSEEEDDGQVVLVTSSDPPTAVDEIPHGPASSAENIILNTPFPAFKQPQTRSSPLGQIIQDTPCQPSRKRPLASSPSRAGSEPPLSSKRHKRSAPISESRSLITRSTSDVGPTASSNFYRTIRPPNERHLTYLERSEIHPTGPPVASTQLTPDDLLTPKLRELARQLNLSKRFRPAEQMRELRPFERGHWLLDWSSWRPTLRERAWHFLTDYLLEGFAGWGVWCKRAEDWSWLRVYCWGHVVGHIYLALYLASERALKTDTARWVDGAGDVIVITNGHENSESGDSIEDVV